MLRGIQQRQNEQAHLYAARYEFVHNRANNSMPEEQTQVNEMIHYALTLLPQPQAEDLERSNGCYHGIQSGTPDCSTGVGSQSWKPVMRNPNWRSPEEVQMRSQTQKQGYNQQGSQPSVPEVTIFRTEELPRKSESKQVRLWIRLQTSVQTRGTTSIMVIEPSTKDNSNLNQTRCLNDSLESTLV